jgi:hypothetical protein
MIPSFQDSGSIIILAVSVSTGHARLLTKNQTTTASAEPDYAALMPGATLAVNRYKSPLNYIYHMIKGFNA